MNKTIKLVLLVLALGFASCHRGPKVTDTNIDAVIASHGTLVFYNAKTQQLTPFEKETDSVISLVFDDKNHLYYTVSNNQQLSLKMLDLNLDDPEPKLCADWNTTLDLAYDYMADRVDELEFDVTNEHIYFYRMDTDMGYMRPLVYNVESGKVRQVDEDEAYDLRDGHSSCNTSRYYTENHLCYYVTNEGKRCLNDKIDIKAYFQDDDELEDLEFTPVSISPDGKTVLYSAVVYWGEGWGYYCLANLDGSMQTLLDKSNIRDINPCWLDNGTLLYIERVPIPETDPEYEPDWVKMRPCIAVYDLKDKTSKMLTLGDAYAVRPRPLDEREKVDQKSLDGCDVALFDNGKVTFYNSETDEFIPYVVDDDSIVNGVFAGDYTFYYSVQIGDGLYLKQVFVGDYVSPSMVTDWELELEDCVSKTYGKVSPLVYIQAFDQVGINHNFSWDFYNFSDIRFYDNNNHCKKDGWDENEDTEKTYYDETESQIEEDIQSFVMMDGNCYFVNDGQENCLSDKINFQDYVSDPTYYETPEFSFRSIDPTRRFVAYAAYIEWGDLGHGPLCIASLDGKMQIALADTDASDLSFGWLSNGSLLYVGTEARPTDDPEYNAEWNNTRPCVIIVRPDGTSSVFAHSADFVVKTTQG